MIWGSKVSDLYSDIQYWRLVSVVGARRSGKDLLTNELMLHWLDKKDPIYKYYSNDLCIWNDPLYITDREKYLERFSVLPDRFPNVADIPVLEKYPDVRYRVFRCTEGGRYLRQYAYFEDIFEFAGKFKDIFFFPSVRPSHEDLMTMVIFPIKVLSQTLGNNLPSFRGCDWSLAGHWGWAVEDGYNTSKTGDFWFAPDIDKIGVFDTDDTSETLDHIQKAIKEEIRLDNIARGRDGIQAVEERFRHTDEDSRQTAQRKLAVVMSTLSHTDLRKKKA